MISNESGSATDDAVKVDAVRVCIRVVISKQRPIHNRKVNR
jgi:hypothetical protein